MSEVLPERISDASLEAFMQEQGYNSLAHKWAFRKIRDWISDEHMFWRIFAQAFLGFWVGGQKRDVQQKVAGFFDVPSSNISRWNFAIGLSEAVPIFSYVQNRFGDYCIRKSEEYDTALESVADFCKNSVDPFIASHFPDLSAYVHSQGLQKLSDELDFTFLADFGHFANEGIGFPLFYAGAGVYMTYRAVNSFQGKTSIGLGPRAQLGMAVSWAIKKYWKPRYSKSLEKGVDIFMQGLQKSVDGTYYVRLRELFYHPSELLTGTANYGYIALGNAIHQETDLLHHVASDYLGFNGVAEHRKVLEETAVSPLEIAAQD